MVWYEHQLASAIPHPETKSRRELIDQSAAANIVTRDEGIHARYE
jgi:hypothetical protein